MKRIIKFVYKNYKNEIAERRVELSFYDDAYRKIGHVFKNSTDLVYREPDPDDEFHPGGGILLSGICLDRDARRSFDITRIIGPITDITDESATA